MGADYWPELRSVVVAPGVKTGVPLLVDNPREVGSDRVVNALAAHSLFDGPVVVVDVDTATTVDAVSARGELLGGAIAPGIDILTGTAEIYGKSWTIYRGSKCRNPDGTVNYTRLELM